MHTLPSPYGPVPPNLQLPFGVNLLKTAPVPAARFLPGAQQCAEIALRWCCLPARQEVISPLGPSRAEDLRAAVVAKKTPFTADKEASFFRSSC